MRKEGRVHEVSASKRSLVDFRERLSQREMPPDVPLLTITSHRAGLNTSHEMDYGRDLNLLLHLPE